MIEDSVKNLPQRRNLCFELLKTLSKEHINGLIHFVACPHFNTDRFVIKLLDVLKKYGIQQLIYNEELKCRIYEVIFPHLSKPSKTLTKNEGSLLSNKLNILMQLVEKFLVYSALDKKDIYYNDLLFTELLQRKQMQLFNRQIKKNQKKISGQKVKDDNYFFNQYKINCSLIFHNEIQDAPIDDLITEMQYNYDISYIINKLETHLIMLASDRMSDKVTFDYKSFNAIEQLIELPEYAKIPIIILYKANIELEKELSVKAYNGMLNLLEEYDSKVPSETLLSFYTNANNFCSDQIEKGNIEFNKIVLDLYKIMHAKNLLAIDNKISIYLLKNIITIACKNKEFDWAIKILEHYKSYISKPLKMQVYDFNAGIIAFYRKDYDAAHEKFITVGDLNFTYYINARILILKCFYEKEKQYSEPTVQAFRSAERYFLNNNIINAQTKKGLKNFIQILINLYRIHHKATKMTKERLLEKLEKQKVNTDKQWLLEKIVEL